MSQSRSIKSKSSRSPSPRKPRSRSKSSQKRSSQGKSKSYEKERRRRTPSQQRGRSPERGPRRNPDLIPKSAKLFVTNIDSGLNYEELKTDLERQFNKFGQVRQIKIRTKRGSANSFAFVEYQKVQDAQAALNGMKGKDFKGKELKVQFGKGFRKQQDRRADKCYICHKQGHFAKDCRYREPSRERRDSRDYGRRRRRSRSSSSSRSPRRRRSYDRQRDRDYRRRDDRSRDYRRSPEKRRQYRTQRRQRY